MFCLTRVNAFSWLAVLVACTLSVPASAQDTTLTESQLQYNNKGVTLINKGEYGEALGYFQSSLAIGEANVTYLNLGRTYTRMERCVDAAAAFEKAESAPAVASPSREEVAAILERYRSELDEICSARLSLRCESDQIDVRIDESPAIECPDQALPVTPGEHTVVASSGDGSRTYTVEAASGEVATLDVSVSTGAVADAPEAQGDPMRTTALVTSIGGGALLLTGLVLDQTVVATQYDELEAASSAGDRAEYDARLEDYRGIRNLNRAVFVAGGVMAASSVVFWLMSGDAESQANTNMAVVPERDGLTIQVGWRL